MRAFDLLPVLLTGVFLTNGYATVSVKNIPSSSPFGAGAEVVVTDRGGGDLTIEVTIPEGFQAQIDGNGGRAPISGWLIVPPQGNFAVEVEFQSAVRVDAASLAVNTFSDRSPEPVASMQLSGLSPQQPVTLGKPCVMRGVRMMPLTVYPQQSIFEARETLLNRSIIARVRPSGGRGDNEVLHAESRPLTPRMQRLMNALLFNPPPRDLADRVRSNIYILYPAALEEDDDAADALDAFIEWKRRSGYSVDAESLEGGDLADFDYIRNTLVREHYEDEPAFENLIIIGSYEVDEDDPFYFASYTFEDDENNLVLTSDHFYSTLDGGDLAPDINVGRFMVETSEQAAGALRRTLLYETDPFMGDDDGAWFTRGLTTTEVDELRFLMLDLGHTRDNAVWAKQKLHEMGYTEVDTVIGAPGNETGEAVRDRLENGASLVIGEGFLYGAFFAPDEGNQWDWSDVARTGRMNPFIIDIEYYYGIPITSKFFATASVDGDEEEYSGPVAAFGLATPDPQIGYIPEISYILGDAVRGLRYFDLTVGGDLQFYTKMLTIAGLGSWIIDENLEANFARLETVLEYSRYLGDPTVDIFTSTPTQLNVDALENYNVGSTSLVLVAEDEEGDLVEGALVSIRQGRNLQYTALTQQDGAAAFTVPEGLRLGTLQITATKHNYRPFIADVDVVTPEVNIILDEGGFDDSEVGDDDGLFRNGETVALNADFNNTGGEDAAGMTATLSSNSRYLVFSRERAAVQNIAAGGSGTFSEPVQMTLSPSCPAGTLIRVQINVGSEAGDWASSFEFTTAGPLLEFAGGLPGNLAPGGEFNLRPLVGNVGDFATTDLAAELTSESEFVSILNGAQNYAAVAAGAQARPAGPFRISVSPLFIPGQTVSFSLNLTGEDESEWVVPIEVAIAEAQVTDPLGPDEYGYLCYDSGDRARWAVAPQYRWREISHEVDGYEFPGQRLPMQEFVMFPGDSIPEDSLAVFAGGASATVALPMNFTYYGERFDSLVVSSNGWLSVDPASWEYVSIRRQPIPGFGAPNGQICVFWQDLEDQHWPYNGVYKHYLADEGVFVVEWQGVNIRENVLASFQVLLYDADKYPTPTGDSEIVFQYKEISMTPGIAATAPFAVVGLRNLDGSGGLEYYSFDHWGEGYPPQAAGIAGNVALKFTTAIENVLGRMRGVVAAAGTRDPIEGAIVNPVRSRRVVTDEDGFFYHDSLRPGIYEEATVSARGYNTQPLAFEVRARQTTILDTIYLTHAEPVADPARLAFDLRPDGSRTRADAALRNEGDGSLEYRVELANPDGSVLAYPSLAQWRLNELVDRGRYLGVAYANNSFFVTSRADEIFVLDRNGNFQRRFAVAVEGSKRIYNLTVQNGQLWGGFLNDDAEIRLVRFNQIGEINANIRSPFDQITSHPIAYSRERNSLFLTEEEQDILEINLRGNVINRWEVSFPGRASLIQALGWNPYDFEGMPLLMVELWKLDDTRRASRLIKMSLETGEWKPVIALENIQENSVFYGGQVYYDYDINRAVMPLLVSHAVDRDDYIRIVDLGPNVSFMTDAGFANQTGVLEPGATVSFGFQVDANGWAEGEYHWGYRVEHNGFGGAVVIPVVMTLDHTAGAGDGGELPREFALRGVYPNPFNPAAKIEFGIDRAERVCLRIIDLAGRELARLVDGQLEAGIHHAVWDGSFAPSGMYLVRLESQSGARTAKMVLVR